MMQSKTNPLTDSYGYILLHILTGRSQCRRSLEQVLELYEDNEDFITEIARAQYLLASVYTESGNGKEGNSWKRKAEDLRRKIMGDKYTVGSSEEGYDKLVNFWSR
jgi:hypothetical protein